MLNDEERAWAEQYHARVYETLAPRLNDDERLWLKAKCEI
jgi:Xaa-Pro aminopeptidase